jgi:hypothetical protein
MNEIGDSYFTRRYHNEVAAADSSCCAKARLVHLELALRYAMLAKPIRCAKRPHTNERVTSRDRRFSNLIATARLASAASESHA